MQVLSRATSQAAQSLGFVTELRLLLQHGGHFEYLNIQCI